nr:group II intron maturase-specific domain-containing protein [Erwinia rhapontici]
MKGNTTLPAWKLINLLNSLILGWATYHQHIVDKDIFNYVDSKIWRAIWQ